jgi:integrase
MLTNNDPQGPAEAGSGTTDLAENAGAPRPTTPPVVARALSQAPSSSVATVAIPGPMRPRVIDPPGAAPGAAPALVAVPLATPPTFSEICDAWLGEALASRKDRGESVRRSMHKDVLPTLGGLPLRAVRRGQVVAVLERIVDRGSARQAGCVLADLRQMFRWAVQVGHTEADPTATLRKNDFGGAPEMRQRRLDDHELLELGQRMREARLARHVRHAVWLMLATGARIGEVAHARWADVDTDARVWTIPAEISHSGRANVVPLSAFAMRHLMPPGELRRSDVWVFPGRVAAEPLSPKALGKQIRDRQRGSQIRGRASGTTALLLPGGAWTPLDLRRTAAALMAELGVRSDVIGACLDHAVRSDSQRAYHRLPSLEERRSALERLGQRLDAIERSGLDPKLRAA